MSNLVLTRRSALQLMAAGGLVLVACQPAPPTAPAPTAAEVAPPTPLPANQAKAGGVLRTALPSDISSLDGHLYFTWSFESTWLAFDRLIEYDDKRQAKPMLAEGWDATPDLKLIKFNLRKGVQFHSGREFTSDDVKWNIIRARDPKVGAGQFSKPSNWFNTIETPDTYTVILKSDDPRPLAFDNVEYFNIVDSAARAWPADVAAVAARRHRA